MAPIAMRPSPALLAAALLAAHAAAAPSGRAQVPAPSRQSVARMQPDAARQRQRDSVRVLRSARGEQALYERVRYAHLPWTESAGSPTGHCDEIVGRFCFWFGDEHDTWTPPPEPPPVGRARERLLARLGDAARHQPGDGWVVGELVRYQVEAGRPADAVAAARACQGAAWWCHALTGYALHAAGDDVGAEAAFDAAIPAMPERTRRRWTDLERLLAPGERRAYGRLRGAARDSVEKAFWRMADPLLTTPGNEARAEHLSRWVMTVLQERARTPEGLPWGDDLGEFLIRYGSPSGWERARPRVGFGDPHDIVSHYPEKQWAFLPSLRDVRNPLGVKPDSWDPDPDQPRVQYPVSGARSFIRLEPQVAVFRRGGKAVVVAAYDLDRDSVAANAQVSAALALFPGGAGQSSEVRASAAGPTGVLRQEVDPAPVLFSLEARADSAGRVGRSRYGLPLAPAPAGLHLSDVLLLTPTESLPATLDAAAPLARGTTRLRARERVGLFWEVYGLAARPDTLSVAVSITPVGRPGFARRAAERLGLATPGAPVTMGWREEANGQTVLGRSLAVALPALRPGEYQLQVAVTTGSGASATTTRSLRVVP
ncbi:MAG TPA: hypothetical protein VFH27_02645 [Longimicrobiaceae bacterium]|nr:hypothetical protein [Longimicrobiaceae bacterium]